MAQAINVILQIAGTGTLFDINKMGLLDMSFTRMPVVTKDTTRSFLPEIQIQVMDKTGIELLSVLQQNSNNLLLKYGYEDNLSEVFKLTVIKMRLVLNNLGSMVVIQAVGSQVLQTFDSEIYSEGTNVNKILRSIAKRNGWYVGDDSDNTYIDTKNITLNRNLVKLANEHDFDFIKNKILPILKSSILIPGNTSLVEYWELTLNQESSKVIFYCRPYSSRSTARRIWPYNYGSVTLKSQVISFTNDIDMSFLLNGISLKIPMTAVDSTIVQDEETFKENITALAMLQYAEIVDIIKQYNLPIPDADNFRFNIEIIDSENVGNKTFAELLLEKLEDVIKVLSKAEMVIIGNPKIMATDLIEFRAKNRTGTNSIISSTGKTYWRIVGIKESIGLGGYHTTLSLVRETVNAMVREQSSSNDGSSSGLMKEIPEFKILGNFMNILPG